MWSLPIVKPIPGMALLRVEAPWGNWESPGELTGYAVHLAAPKEDGAAHFCGGLPIISPQWCGELWDGTGCLPLPLSWAGGCTQLLTGLGTHWEPVSTPSQSMYKADTYTEAPTLHSMDRFYRGVSSARFGQGFIPFKRNQHRVSSHSVLSLCGSLLLSL